MYFRIKADSVNHVRQVFSVMDWLGAIGGIEGMLYDFLTFFLGGFIQYNAVIQSYQFMTTSLRKNSSVSHSAFSSEMTYEDCQIVEMSTYQRVKMYLASQYSIFERVALRSHQDKQLKESLDKCMNQSDFDFNLTSIILDYKERQRRFIM